MTEQDKEHFEDILVKAVQSTKQENSGLVDMIMHKLESKIEESINKNVNGKINALHTKIDTYITGDLAWKESVTPSIEVMKNLMSFGSVSGYIGRTILLIGGIVSAIYASVKFVLK